MGSKLVIFVLIFCVPLPRLEGKFHLLKIADSTPSNGHAKEKDHGHGEVHKYGKDHRNHKYGKDHGNHRDHVHGEKHRKGKDYGNVKDHGNGGKDYELTKAQRCNELRALCKGRQTCLEGIQAAMNTHSHM